MLAGAPLRAASQRPRPALHPAFVTGFSAQQSPPASPPPLWRRAKVAALASVTLLALLFLSPPLLYRLRGTEHHRSALADGPGPALGRPDETWQEWQSTPLARSSFAVTGAVTAMEAEEAQLVFTPAAQEAALEVPATTRAAEEPVALPAVAAQSALDSQLEAARRISPDVFGQLPASFDAAYKSPCWRDATGELRCLPAFMVLGVFQCGVKDIFERLAKHPDVAAVEAPHWWDEVHPLSVYLERFARALPAIEAAPARMVSGDVSFATFSFTWTGSQRVNVEWAASMKECREECARTSTGDDERRACIDGGCYTRAANAYKGLRLSVPQLMRSVYRSFPLRMVVVLRDPVERLHTAFWNYEHYAKKYGATEEGFSTYALEMVGHAQLCLAKHSEFDCLTGFESLEPRFEEVFYHADQLWKGVYSTFFEGWEASFPGAVLPIRLEDYAAPGGVRETLQRVIPHLRLTPLEEPALAALLEGDVRTQGEPTLRARRGVMDEKTRVALREFYAPFNAKLATLLGDDKWRWGY